MRGPSARPIVIAAGGTGGHFFPAEALGAELVARGHRIALMTDGRSSAQDSAVFAGRERFVLRGAGIAGRGALRGGKAALALAAGAMQARATLGRLDAAAVIGFGGYPSVAPTLGARASRRRPPVLLHEQNAVLGRANRFLLRYATAVALSFEQTEGVPHGAERVLTGNPVRSAITWRPYEPGGARILVLGGSLGARVFSDVVPAALAALPDPLRGRVSVAQQCRAEDLDRVRDAYDASGIAAELATFFPDVADRLATASLVIARAGASTVAELAVAGRPAILVPLPSAIDDHQNANARALADAGAAWVMPQPSLTASELAGRIASLFDEPAVLTRSAAAACAQACTDAAARLADLVERCVTQDARR